MIIHGKWFLAAGVAIFLLALGAPLTLAADLDALDEVVLALVGSGATDCGFVGIRGDRTKVDACVVAAYKAGGPFRARYDVMGVDSAVSEAVLRTTSGRVFFVKYDSDQGGGQGIGSSVDLWSCPKPQVQATGAAARLTCPSHDGRP